MFLVSSRQKNELKCQSVFITEILWRIFWRDNCWSLFDVVKNLCYHVIHYRVTNIHFWKFSPLLKKIWSKMSIIIPIIPTWNVMSFVQVSQHFKKNIAFLLSKIMFNWVFIYFCLCESLMLASFLLGINKWTKTNHTKFINP